jgi:ribosomal-protein-alanine N-acetyltransferase
LATGERLSPGTEHDSEAVVVAYPDIPDVFPVLQAPGIVLREIGPEDGDAWYRRLNDPESLRLTADEPVESREMVDVLIRGMGEGFRDKEIIRWAIVLEDSGESVGSVGYNVLHARDRRAEMGYALNREWWGQGIMPRAAAAVVDYGFVSLGLRRIDAHVVATNSRSFRVLEKLGFEREGTLRQFKFLRGQRWDFYVYGLLAEEWQRPDWLR